MELRRALQEEHHKRKARVLAGCSVIWWIYLQCLGHAELAAPGHGLHCEAQPPPPPQPVPRAALLLPHLLLQEAEALVAELSEVVQHQKLRMRVLAQEKAEAAARLAAMNPQVMPGLSKLFALLVLVLLWSIAQLRAALATPRFLQAPLLLPPCQPHPSPFTPPTLLSLAGSGARALGAADAAGACGRAGRHPRPAGAGAAAGGVAAAAAGGGAAAAGGRAGGGCAVGGGVGEESAVEWGGRSAGLTCGNGS